MKDAKEIISIIQIAFRSKKLNLFHRAYKERRGYKNFNFLKEIISEKWGIDFRFNYYETALDLSYEIARYINEDNLSIYIEICFHMFCRISMLVIDRYISGKLKQGNKELLSKIITTNGNASYMKVLKNLFVDLKMLPENFEFGNYNFYKSIAKGFFL